MFADLVVFQMLLAVEAFATVAARVQRMIDVLGLVLLELVFARERHRAVVALERPHVRVASERMALQMKRGLERLAAFVTRLVFESLVLTNVLGELSPCLVG